MSGLSGVSLTSFSVVIVVVPLGVSIFISCFEVVLDSLHPIRPRESDPRINVVKNKRFMFETFCCSKVTFWEIIAVTFLANQRKKPTQ